MASRRGSSQTDGGRAERETVAAYHKEQLCLLLEHVRQGLDRLTEGEIDEFEMDELIHHYSRSAKELWKFCGYGGNRVDWAAHSLGYVRDSESEPNWWEIGRPGRRD